MPEYYNVTTNLGDAEIANAIATNTKLDITHVAFGDGNGSAPTPNKARTSLVREVHRQAVTKYERHTTNANWIVIETVIPSDIGGFTIREMGIIGNGKLISHGSHAPFEKLADPSGVSEYRLKFTQNITDGNVVSITLDESLIFATQAWVEENFIKRSEIVDNLITNDSTKPVSAKQAKILKDNITAIEDIVLYAPIAWPSTTIPSGHLALMGQSISQAQHPKLFALYGSTLPDMRAYSIRGLDFGRGIDVGRTILSGQLDDNKEHHHGVLYGTGNRTNTRLTLESSYTNILGEEQFKLSGDFFPANSPVGRSSDLTMASMGGSETRVKSVAFLYIVKAG